MAETRTVKCASCDEATEEFDFDRGWGCIHGTFYGHCSSPDCGGLCEDHGSCDCVCHEA